MSQNIFSLEGLISWLKEQNPSVQYIYASVNGCLLHQYFTARGVPIRNIAADGWSDTISGENHEYPRELEDVALGFPRTYGAALQRARELLAEERGDASAKA